MAAREWERERVESAWNCWLTVRPFSLSFSLSPFSLPTLLLSRDIYKCINTAKAMWMKWHMSWVAALRAYDCVCADFWRRKSKRVPTKWVCVRKWCISSSQRNRRWKIANANELSTLIYHVMLWVCRLLWLITPDNWANRMCCTVMSESGCVRRVIVLENIYANWLRIAMPAAQRMSVRNLALSWSSAAADSTDDCERQTRALSALSAQLRR